MQLHSRPQAKVDLNDGAQLRMVFLLYLPTTEENVVSG